MMKNKNDIKRIKALSDLWRNKMTADLYANGIEETRNTIRNLEKKLFDGFGLKQESHVEKAKPGDIIEVLNEKLFGGSLIGKECIVINSSLSVSINEDLHDRICAHLNQEVWCGTFWLEPDEYKIIRRANRVFEKNSSCPDCRGTGKITLFTSIATCGCRKTEIQK